MNEMSPLRPDLAEIVSIGNRRALLLPEGFVMPDGGQWAIAHFNNDIRLVPYIEADWTWAAGVAGSMSDDFARAVEEGRIGPDHPSNALDDEPDFN